LLEYFGWWHEVLTEPEQIFDRYNLVAAGLAVADF